MISFRSFWRSLAALMVLGAALLPAAARAATAQSSQDGFDPSVNGNVYAIATQSDGKVIVGGSFTTTQPYGMGVPVTRNRLARYNADGTLDTSFDPNFDFDVYAVTVQRDGKILVGGRFTRLQPGSSSSATERVGIVRLNADGSIDAAFNPKTGGYGSTNVPVSAIALQSDGKILIGGGFTTLQPNGASSTTSRRYIARLNTDGTVDTAFNPSANNVVFAIAVQSDGKIVIGGGFTQLAPNGGSTVNRGRIARLNTDGTVDTSLDISADNRVLALAVHPSGSITLGGDFRNLTPAGASSGTGRPFLARITSSGALDTNYIPAPNAYVDALAFQSDGKLLVGGNFTSVQTSDATSAYSRSYLARLKYDGTMDTEFAASPDMTVNTIAVQGDTRILIGGLFGRVRGSDTNNSLSRSRVARLQADGSLDALFGTLVSGSVTVLARQSDGSLVIGGSFNAQGGATRYNLARISASGVLDPNFKPLVNNRVTAAVVQSDGKIVIGGQFTSVENTQRFYAARLNADGTLDTSYDPKFNDAVSSMFLQSDGKIIVGGSFSTVQPNSATETTAIYYLARLNTDGTLDTTYKPTPNSPVYAMVQQSDNNLIVGGAFTAFSPNGGSATGRSYLARITPAGAIDSSYNPNLNKSVYALAFQSDGKLLVGGAFTALAPNGATTSTTRNYVVRLDAKGNVDTTFDPSPNGTVFGILARSDGSVLIGGTFTTVQPNGASTTTNVGRFAHLKSDGTLAGTSPIFFNADVSTFYGASDNSVLVAGGFTAAYSSDNVAIAAENHILRLTSAVALDTSYRLTSGNSGSSVNALGYMRDGTILAGGSFSDVAGGRTKNLARLTGNGEADVTFTTSADQPVNAIAVQPIGTATTVRPNRIGWLEGSGVARSSFNLSAVESLTGTGIVTAVQPDGKILLGGQLTNASGNTSSHLIRINANGTYDTTFAPTPGDTVRAIAVLSNGDILVGGSFVTMGGVTRNYMAKLHADGSLDTGFNPSFSGQVNTILVLSTGKILVGGAFATLQPGGTGATTTRNNFVRLNADGTIDTAFDPNFNGAVQAVILDGEKYVVVGGFTTAQPNAATSATARKYIARLNSDGTLDTTFDPAPNSNVSSISRLSDGSGFVIGGSFTSFNPNGATTATSRFYIARINSDGTLDTNFAPTFNAGVSAVATNADKSVYVAGPFNFAFSAGSNTGMTRNYLAKVNADGTIDATFNPNPNGTIYGINLQSDGSLLLAGSFSQIGSDPVVLVGGSFQTIGGASIPYLSRLGSDGNPDATFQPAPNGTVNGLAVLSDGRFYAVGDFTRIGGADHARIARFNRDGTIDGSFTASADGSVRTAVLQSDGKLLLGGSFGAVNGTGRARLARLNSDGSLDGSFTATINGAVSSVVAQRDGKVIIAGEFTQVSGASKSKIARLNSDGSLDASFTASTDANVYSLGLQADGHVYIGGDFSTVGGVAHANFARLNSDGSIDTTIAATANGAVRAIALEEDGRPLIGGSFTEVSGQSRHLIARLANSETANQSLTVNSDRSVISWARLGSAPNLSSVWFEYSTDGTTWVQLGAGIRSSIAEVWQWSGASNTFPGSSVYYIRAVSIVPTTQYSSAGIVEVAYQFFGSTPVGPNSTAAANSGGSSDSNDSGSGGTGGSSGGASSGGSSGGGTSTGGSGSSSTAAGLINLSTRMQMDASETVITGFVINGSSAKRVLVRAIGPSLSTFGVNNPVSRPQLKVYDTSGAVIATGAQWQTDAKFATWFSSAGAFPLASSAADSVAALTLTPGAYTVHVQNQDNTGGILLTEVYEVDRDSDVVRFINLSARGSSGTGEKVLIGGFIIQGDGPVPVMIRGLGPALTKYNVPNTLPDPRLRVYNSSQTVIAENDNWSAADVSSATASVGAAELAAGSKDAAIVLTLNPGAYTAIVSDVNGATGNGLIEIFDLRTQ